MLPACLCVEGMNQVPGASSASLEKNSSGLLLNRCLLQKGPDSGTELSHCSPCHRHTRRAKTDSPHTQSGARFSPNAGDLKPRCSPEGQLSSQLDTAGSVHYKSPDTGTREQA